MLSESRYNIHIMFMFSFSDYQPKLMFSETRNIYDVVVGDQWLNHFTWFGPMDSVQVGKAVFVK